MDPAADRALLRDLLPGVSRSFALSLRVLPASLRAPFGLTYLVARAADTMADTRALPPPVRHEQIEGLRRALRVPGGGRLRAAAPLAGGDHLPAERRLLDALPEVLGAYHRLGPGDRARTDGLLLTLTQAMLDALDRFPPESTGRLVAFETLTELERYTYMNAGCVGEFWTEMVVAHRPRCRGWNVALMRARGARFGQGLQLVNVLRDLPRDLRSGRCYLPRAALGPLGLTPEALLDPGALLRLRPLVTTLVEHALTQLADALAYTLAVPRGEPRLRLACAWPLLIGLRTLARIAAAPDLLDPAMTVKIARPAVRRLLLASCLLVLSNRALGGYARRLADEARWAARAPQP